MLGAHGDLFRDLNSRSGNANPMTVAIRIEEDLGMRRAEIALFAMQPRGLA